MKGQSGWEGDRLLFLSLAYLVPLSASQPQSAISLREMAGGGGLGKLIDIPGIIVERPVFPPVRPYFYPAKPQAGTPPPYFDRSK